MKTAECARALSREIGKIIVGKRDIVDLVITAVLSGGHVLLDDLPGSGKTTLVRTLALALGCEYKRIQFTPDLLPSDVLGMTVFNQKTGDFERKVGPIRTNLLLADEINRAIPRTQSALLEAMEERQITIDGETYPQPDPFFVMATQNPVEKESTFPLPAAQMDRFFMKLSMGYPSREEEVQMLSELGDETPYQKVEAAASPGLLQEIRGEIREIYLSEEMKGYIVELVHRTREHSMLKTGASPRASRSLFQGSKTCAAMAGRDYVTPEDVQKLIVPVLSHRVVLTGDARYSGRSPEELLREMIRDTPVPPAKEAWFDGKAKGIRE
ncbi:AAA family ATPase [Hominifimenecus sp. rT4P-3]|uniref:AAA family ATPase n=1 Tax=Hominifimenecus sp. rT4P-3 TaxID=3242979 RepID=UPI003DA4C5C0